MTTPTLESEWTDYASDQAYTTEADAERARRTFLAGVSATLTLLRRGVSTDDVRAELAGIARLMRPAAEVQR